MRQLIPICIILLGLIHANNHVSGYIVDYSDKTWPYMVIRVAHLEMERKELVYGDKVVPKKNGLIELECNVAESSFLSSLGPDLAKKVTGVKWETPDPNIIEENRAYVKELGNHEPKLQSLLVITDFKKEEDMGEYSCHLAFENDPLSKYSQKIFIPSLDGAPILKCEFECQRNADDACQLLGEYSIHCQAYNSQQSTPFIHCDFDECESESICPPNALSPAPPGFGKEFFNRPTPMYKLKSERVRGGLAVKSGAFNCEAASEEGVSALRLFMPVTVNEAKDGLLQIKPDPPMPLPPMFETSIPSVLEGTYRYYDDHAREFGCWTSQDVEKFQWSFRSIANREFSQNLSENALPGLSIKDFDVAGGQASVLRIRDVNTHHGGYYFCEAANPQDNVYVHKQFEISAGVWKDDANVNRKATITRHQGSSVTLRCSMRTTGSHIVTWIKTDPAREISGNVGPEPNVELSHDYEILTIHNLTLEDSGIYECSDSFDVNSLNGEVTLKVVDEPFDHYEQIEKLQDAVKELREAEDDISDIVQIIAVQHPRDPDDNDSREEDSSEEED